ncbi:MAG: amidohydrolase family protein [Proteobacteria bacterium]|nr:amidohydrolase family protein [Pseudomonadota bacterium]
MSRLIFTLLACFFAAMAAAANRFDVIIRHGELLDGSGRPGYVADVAVQDGYIVAIGDLANEKALRDIDARGYLVTPGFINIHSHAEPNALPTAHNMLAQGVTTEILNPDGDGPLEIGAQLRELQRWGLAENVGAYIGFNSVWENTVGLADRRPSAQQTRQMRALVTRGLQQGAWGVSAGLDYKPAYFARTDEVISVVSAAARWRTNFPSHERIIPPAYSSRAGITETIAIASAAGLAPEITHIKAQGHEQGRGPDIVALMAEASAHGHYTPADVYPYLAGLTYLESLLIPGWAQEGGPEAMRHRFADPALRERIARESEAAMNARLTGGPAGVFLPLVNKSLPDFMESEHVGAGEALLRILERAGDQEVPAILRFGADSDLEAFLGYRGTAVACDCGATLRKLIHPRYYGTFPRVLARYVRDKNLLTWEQAIQRMTGLPASTTGMVDRGFLQPGMAADLVVLDRNTINDHATFEAPWLAPDGVREVLVGGRVEWDNGAPTGEKGGRPLFRSRHMPTRPASSESQRALTVSAALAAAAPGGSSAGRLVLDLHQDVTDRHAVGTARIESASKSDSLEFQSLGELQVAGHWASFTGVVRWGAHTGPATLIIDAEDSPAASAVMTLAAKGRHGSWTLPSAELHILAK